MPKNKFRTLKDVLDALRQRAMTAQWPREPGPGTVREITAELEDPDDP